MADEVRAKLIYDISDASRKVNQLDKELKRLERPIRLDIRSGDITGVHGLVAKARSSIGQGIFEGVKSGFQNGLDQGLTAGFLGFGSRFNKNPQLQNIQITIKIDDGSLNALQKRVQVISNTPIESKLHVDDSQLSVAQKGLQALVRRARSIESKVVVDDTQVEGVKKRLSGVQQQLKTLGQTRETANLDVQVTGGGAVLLGGTSGGAAAGAQPGGGLSRFFAAAGGASQLLDTVSSSTGKLSSGLENLSGAGAKATPALQSVGSAASGAGKGFLSAASSAGPYGLAVAAVAAVTLGAVLATIKLEEVLFSITEKYIGLASAGADLSESLNASNLIFEDQAGAIVKVSDTAAKSFGLAEAEFISLGNTIGASLRGLDIPLNKLSDTTQLVIQTATDLGSAYNISTQQGVLAIQAGLRGEFQQLEQLKIFIRQSDVDTEAVRLGLAKNTLEVDKQARAWATLSLVQKQASLAAGDFSNTLATSLPNQLKVFRSGISDIKTEFSGFFVKPAIGIVATLNKDLVPALKNTFNFAKPVIKALAEIGGKALIKNIELVANAITLVTKGFQGFLLFAIEGLESLGIASEQQVHNIRRLVLETEAARLRELGQQALELKSIDELIKGSEKISFDAAIISAGLFTEELEKIKAPIEEAIESFDRLNSRKLGKGIDLAQFKLDLLDFQEAAHKAGGFVPLTEENIGKLGQKQLEVQIDLSKKFQSLLSARAELFKSAFTEEGTFNPAAFDFLTASLAGVGIHVAQTKEDVDRLKGIFNELPQGQQVLDIIFKSEFQGLQAAALQAAGTDYEKLILLFKANPEIEASVRLNNVDPTLSNATEIKTVLGILDGTIVDPELNLDLTEFDRKVKLGKGRIEDLDRLVATPGVTLNDQATPKIDGVVAAILKLTGVHTATVIVNDQASGPLGFIKGLLDNIKQVRGIVVSALQNIANPRAEGGIIRQEEIARLAEGNRPELVLPLTKPWARQKSLLEESGVLRRLEAEFSNQEQARARTVNRQLAQMHAYPVGSGSTTRELELVATRMEKAAAKIAKESRPVNVQVSVPPVSDPQEQARHLLRKLRKF